MFKSTEGTEKDANYFSGWILTDFDSPRMINICSKCGTEVEMKIRDEKMTSRWLVFQAID